VSARKGFCSAKSPKENAKIFKELLYKSIGRPGCTQILAVLTETANKNRKEFLSTITIYRLSKRKTTTRQPQIKFVELL